MSNQRYTPEFKDEAARQIVDRGYSVADVSERLGVSAHSLYKWVKAIKPDKTEEQDDGHRERGYILGLEYVRQVTEHWGWGAAFEREAFGSKNNRHGILVVPLSYFPNECSRLLAGPGVEFHEPGDPDSAVFRLGASYEFELGKQFTLSPEAVIDFVEGGTTVYVLGFSLGYGF